MAERPESEPRVAVVAIEQRPDPAARQWLVTWRIQNSSRRPLALLATRQPHDRFYAQEQPLASELLIPPGQSRALQLAVTCGEPPGTVVENAFLILKARWGSESWRILARLRVEFQACEAPQIACERLTVQPIGFSGRIGGTA